MRRYALKKTISLAVVGILAYKRLKKETKTVKRKKRRIPQSEFSLHEDDPFEKIQCMGREEFAEAVRMSPETFDMLLSLVRPRLERNSVRRPVSPECRLFVTLKYLAHGGSQMSYSQIFKLGVSTTTKVIYETCQDLWNVLNETYLPPPNSDMWVDVATEFEHHWRLPNCIGAIDGMHVNIACPPRNGSGAYFKGKHSIVLLGVCDARYTFTMVDVGVYGNQIDGGIFTESSLGQLLANNKLDIPEAETLPNSMQSFPYFFVGSNALPLKSYLMRPFPGNSQLDEETINFNKRISHARRAVENTFGILSARWTILNKDINALPANVDVIVKATVLLHNILMLTRCTTYCPENYADRVVDNEVILGQWRNETSFAGLPASTCHNSTREACHLRKILSQYLMQFE